MLSGQDYWGEIAMPDPTKYTSSNIKYMLKDAFIGYIGAY